LRKQSFVAYFIHQIKRQTITRGHESQEKSVKEREHSTTPCICRCGYCLVQVCNQIRDRILESSIEVPERYKDSHHHIRHFGHCHVFNVPKLRDRMRISRYIQTSISICKFRTPSMSIADKEQLLCVVLAQAR
jgi:hypothetical protein